MTHVVHVLSDAIIDDAGKYLLNYLENFDRVLFRVTVILPENCKLANAVSAIGDVTLIESPRITAKTYDKQCVAYLKDLFLKIKPHIVQTHICPSACIAGKKAKVPAVLSTEHRITQPEQGIKAMIYRFLYRSACNYYLAVSDAAAIALAESGIAQHKIKITGTGISPVRRASVEAVNYTRLRYGVKDDEVLFGIFGRLDPDKGHKYFIKAARQVVKEYPKAKFIIVGAGSFEEELRERITRHGLEETVILAGFVDNVNELLSAVDILVNASKFEAMSLSLMEAMSLSKPVIATRVGGNNELITDNEDGILINYGDSTSLALAMLRLICNPDLCETLAEAAGKKIAEKFTVQKTVTRLEDVYKEVYKDRQAI